MCNKFVSCLMEPLRSESDRSWRKAGTPEQERGVTEPRYCSCGDAVVPPVLPSTHNGVVRVCRGSLTHTECEPSCG